MIYYIDDQILKIRRIYAVIIRNIFFLINIRRVKWYWIVLFCACGILSTDTYTYKCTSDNRQRIDGLLHCVYVTHTFVLFI